MSKANTDIGNLVSGTESSRGDIAGTPGQSSELQRLAEAFNAMLERIESSGKKMNT